MYAIRSYYALENELFVGDPPIVPCGLSPRHGGGRLEREIPFVTEPAELNLALEAPDASGEQQPVVTGRLVHGEQQGSEQAQDENDVAPRFRGYLAHHGLAVAQRSYNFV